MITGNNRKEVKRFYSIPCGTDKSCQDLAKILRDSDMSKIKDIKIVASLYPLQVSISYSDYETDLEQDVKSKIDIIKSQSKLLIEKIKLKKLQNEISKLEEKIAKL